LNADRAEKLRIDEWLISTILREINQLERMSEAEHKTPGKPPARTALLRCFREKAY
jgi:hypothetical protein